MILRGMKSKNLITRGLGKLAQIVAAVRRYVSYIKRCVVEPEVIRSVFKKSKIKRYKEPVSTIKSMFKRR